MRRPIVTVLLSILVGAAAVVAPVSEGATQRVVPTVATHASTAVTAARKVVLDKPAEHVAVYWRGNPHAQVSVALSSDGDHFGLPVDAGRDEVGEQRQDGTTYGAVHDAHGAVAVRITTDRPIARLTVLGMSDGADAVRSTVTGASAEAATTQPQVVPRSGWGADESLMTWAPQFYATKKLIVHHTATANDYVDRAGAESQLRSIYYYHSVTQGWGDIGYNFVIDKFGNVYEGRYSRDYAGANPSGDDASGRGVTGAHASGWNSGTVGVAMLGTFTDQDVTPAARDSLEALLAWEASRNGIDPTATQAFTNPVSGATTTTPNIAGHRDYAATECPGGVFYQTLPALRTAVAARISGSPPPMDTQPPSAPTSLSAVAGRTQVTLRWSASTDDSGTVAGYRVWRSRTQSGTFSQVATVGGTSYINTGLARRTTYFYKIQAYDAAGNVSGFSSTVSARTT